MIKTLIVLAFLGNFSNPGDDNLKLTKNGRSRYRIVLPAQPTAIEQRAAAVFQDYVGRISGAKLRIVPETRRARRREILIGRVARAGITDAGYEELEKDGFMIRTQEQKLVIAGGTEKGALYGVYTFLETYLGCRKYSSVVTFVPEQPTIVLGEIDDQQVPWFKFREVYYRDVYDQEYMDWHKLDCHGGTCDRREWGFWCHSFNALVPPEEFAETHPEYYSLIDNMRQPGTQLCLTNPEVFEVLNKNLRMEIDKNPDLLYWSVSQNDNAKKCTCDSCRKLDEDQGTPMGSMLPFVNRVAREYPDRIISTLAYWYTRKPPKNILPEKNVNIMLCNIESPRHLTLQAGDTSFCNDLAVWGSMTDNIILWDYVIQFKNLLAPFPNLRTLQPNIRYFKTRNVTALFEQGNREIGGEFAELRAYLLAKLVWDPDLDYNETMDDFLRGYYDAAGPPIRRYVDLLHDQLERTGASLGIFGSPVQARETFLSDSLLNVYASIFDEAEDAVRTSPELLARVKTARLPIIYSVLEIARAEKTGARGAFALDPSGNRTPNGEIEQLAHEFLKVCNQKGVTRVSEWHTTPKEYYAQYMEFLHGNALEESAPSN
jgi:hypothetical protein